MPGEMHREDVQPGRTWSCWSYGCKPASRNDDVMLGAARCCLIRLPQGRTMCPVPGVLLTDKGTGPAMDTLSKAPPAPSAVNTL